jgi:hypothetical protein
VTTGVHRPGRGRPVDNSAHQRIDSDGSDFYQTIDDDPVIASGDDAVAAGAVLPAAGPIVSTSFEDPA